MIAALLGAGPKTVGAAEAARAYRDVIRVAFRGTFENLR
jgi:hypothetical protein